MNIYDFPQTVAKGLGIIVRASAVLLNSGAYDPAPTAGIDVRAARIARLVFFYTRGAQNGSYKFQVYTSQNGTDFDLDSVLDGSSLAAGSLNAYDAEFKTPALSAASTPTTSRRSFKFDVSDCGWIAVAAAESGVTATPGTLLVTAGLGV